VKRRALPLTALAAAAVLTGCGPVGVTTSASAVVSEAAQAAGQVSQGAPAPGRTAVAVLASLPVKGRAPMTGYARDQFGPAWADVDHNGCDTRNDVLTRDLTDETYKAGTHDCVVTRGTLADPYTGTSIGFVRGSGASVDIDHVVALGDAWQTGADRWDDARRTALANDPANLLAVDYSENRKKGDGDAASWLPPATGYRCAYVARQVAVKATYGLWVTSAEHDAIARVLTGCPDQPVPTPASSTLASSTPATSTAAATPAATAPAAPASTAPAGPFPDCTAARAAGAAPLHSGDPGWNAALDRDGDGTACE